MNDLAQYPARPVARPLRSAFTLVELLMAMTVSSILLLATASTILIAMRAIDDEKGPDTQATTSRRTADLILNDLAVASAIGEQTDISITMSVPDRDADGNMETIRYAWSGVPGDPLTRRNNDGPVVTLVANVHLFNLNYLVRTIGPPPAPPGPVQEETPEQLLICHDDAPSGNMKICPITPTKWWAAQFFRPPLPANAVAWKVTRVKVMMEREAGPSETYFVQIRTANASQKPTSQILESVSYRTDDLDNAFYWVEIPFVTIANIPPGEGLCLVVGTSTSALKYPILRYEENGSPMTSNTHWMTSTDSGSSWSSPNTTQDMWIYVYGTITVQY